MKVKRIRLKNGYKRFHDLTIDLGEEPARIVALVGPNGCGKSSVFDGLLFHAAAFGDTKAGPSHQKPAAYHTMPGSTTATFQNIEIEFETGGFNAVREQKSAAGRPATIFSFRSPYRHNNALKISETKATADIAMNNAGAAWSDSVDSRMEDNYRRLTAHYSRFMNENDCRPSEARLAIIGDLNESIGNCLELTLVDIGNVEDNKGTLYFTKPDQPTGFEFNVLSSGEKEVVDILLDLYLRRDVFDQTVFLIDEPELHISTAIQRKLLIEIDRLLGDECQLWVSTHSIGFLRALKNDFANDCQVIHFPPGARFAAEAATLRPIDKSLKNWKKFSG